MIVTAIRPIQSTILEPTGDSAKSLIIHGQSFSAGLDTDTEFDITFSEDRDLQGINTEITDGAVGDWMRIAIVHPITEEEIRVLAEGTGTGGVPIPPSANVSIVAEGTAFIPTGVIIRFTYHSVATEGANPMIYIRLRQWR
jgi:hypothetical protein